MKKFFTIVAASILLTFASFSAMAQAGVLNVNDPDVIFTTSTQPAAPTWNQISKWGHTNVLAWNPYSYGYLSYYFQGMAFRLKFPKSYKQGVVDGKKYPVFIFFHGLGEAGTIWDNEYQLFHGGQIFAEAVNDSAFDGFVLTPQSQGGYMQSYFPAISNLIDSMVKYTKVDLDRISINGLSAGGQATWNWMGTQSYAQQVCSILPISAADYDTEPTFQSFITTPVWVSNGGQDVAPYPSTVTDIINYYKSFGGNIIQSFYPNDGHDAWDDFWNEPNLWPWIVSQHKANPLVYFQHNAFCPNAPVAAELGVQSGFYAYQWQKNGLTISGAVGDSLNVTAYGTYACRYERTATSGWSVWSPKPVVISQMQPTVTPPIQISGLHSNVLPAPDGSTTVPLMVPNTYASYEWHRVNGTDSIVSTTNTFNAPIGQYDVRVTQQFGCSSNFSPVDTVVAANGTNVPPPASNVSALAISSSSIEIDWNANPNPAYSQTGFEIYRTTTSGTNYTLVAITGSNALTYLDQGLSPNVKYYYIIRAINKNGAAPITAEVSAVTKSDVTPPTVPSNLSVTGTTRSSVSLAWNPSTDDVGVVGYDIFINGVKAYSTTGTTFTINNLTALQTYSFYVEARDGSGNESPASAQVSATAALNGLTYSYYEGTWTTLPYFPSLTPLATGNTPNVSLAPALATSNYGFMWQGSIIITKAGSYTFETNSDDGSDLYIGTYSATATPLVNNDGAHSAQSVTGKITLAVGVYPITITYFQGTGTASMNVYWTSTANGIARQLIPNSAFADVVTPGAIPAAPGSLNVLASSYNKINLTWVDNSTNETGFEVSRATSRTGTYQALGTTAAGVTSFIDSVGLNANTKYWYRIRSVNSNGASAYVSTLQAAWLFNNDLTDASGNNHILTGTGTTTFSSNSVEGGLSLSLDGATQYADMTSTGGIFPSNSYTTRTIGLWINPTAATISGTNKIVYNLGGADNGIGLRFNAGSLIAGIASNNVRSTITVSSIATNANWISGGWNYVTIVYNVNALQLYVNGVLKGSATLSFSSIAASTVSSRIGASGTTNAFNTTATSTFYGGLIDDMEIDAEPVSATGVVSLMNQSYPADTTFVLPVVPATPSNLVGQALSASRISLTFTDNSSNETGFQLYRALISDTNFRLQATINPGAGIGSQVTYIDTAGLYANTNYYYRVRAIGVGGNSAFTSPDILVTTLNDKPHITQIAGFTMRYGSQVSVPVNAIDIDGDPITFVVLNLPTAFATLTNTGAGTATLLFSPGLANQGSYTMSVVAADNHSGTDTTTFTVVVNADYVPVATPVSSQTMNEGDSLAIPLSATDPDGNSTLVWSLTSAPSFAKIGTTINGAATLTLKPGYAAAGSYSIIASVADGSGGIAADTISLTVINKNPPTAQTVYMDMRYNSPAAPAPWNNIYGVSTTNLLDANGVATGIGLQFQNTSWYAWNAGDVTGNNSGVYPDAAISDYFYFGIYGAPATVNVALTGLNTASTYNVTLFGSSTYTGAGTNGSTIYAINGVQKSVNVSFNQQNTAAFTGISPDNTGTITVDMSVAAGSPYGVVNTIVLQKQLLDTTKPALPTGLTSQTLSTGYVQLNWTDVAYNELNYLVYRSTSATGPFVLLPAGTIPANSTSYTDSTVTGNTTYYYEIAATNANGSSGLTAAVSAVTKNRVPVLTPINTTFVKTGTSKVVTITTADDPANVLTTVVSNLPSFATYKSTGNGTGTITLAPPVSTVGDYKNIVVAVSDKFGVTVTDTFNVIVTDSSLRSVYINFNGAGTATQGAPWNNYSSYPYVNSPVGNLMDDNNVNTGFSFKLLDQWDGNLAYGLSTGSNSGVFPDNVLQTSIYSGNTNAHVIEIDGLNPSKRYDIGFLTSFNGGDPLVASFTNGTQTVSVDGMYNTTKLAQLNGITPTAAGAIQVTLKKSAAAAYLNLAAMVVQEYYSTTPIISPYNLFVTTNEDTSTITLTWTDRSSNETGFQIWRSTSANGTYTLITTTAANVTTYTNTGLTSNTRYYYKVRAINGTSVTSNYSNIATTKIAAGIVFVNLNVDPTYNGPAPWNNTASISAAGEIFNSLINNKSVNTGFNMAITEGFNNEGYYGKSGTGIFPGPVMTSNYWTDAGATSEIVFGNLDLRRKYRIGCFGSNASINFTTAAYICNGKTVYLNSYDDSSKVVYLDKLVPNVNGQLVVDIATVTGSPYSFTSAFTLEYYDDTDTYVPVSLNRPGMDTTTDSVLTAAAPIATAITGDNVSVNIYPNPFTSNINVELDGGKAGLVGLLLYNSNAQLVYSQTVAKQDGNQVFNINIPNANHLAAGNYVLDVLLDGEKAQSFVLIKVD